MRTNAWVVLEETRALSWRDWLRWLPEQEGDEPPLSNFEKKAALRLADMDYIYKRFLRPTIQTKVWIMLSIYDVTITEVNAGITQLGDAAQGGDFGCAAFWNWQEDGAASEYIDEYPWRPAQVLLFMPPFESQEGEDPPPNEIRDVNLLFGQPAREFPL